MKRAFTLIEILVVIAIVALLAAIIFNNVTSNRIYPTNKKFERIRNKISFFPQYKK